MQYHFTLQHLHSVASLLTYLAQGNAFGSVGVSDFRRQQFVVSADGRMQLVDLDDLALVQTACEQQMDCARMHMPATNCTHNQCNGTSHSHTYTPFWNS